MLKFKSEINVSSISQAAADKKAKLAEQLVNNLDESALEILAKKSAKPGMSDKVRNYQHFM